MPSYPPVYSQQFILNTEEAPNTEYAVPAGYVADIRQVTAFAAVAAVNVQVFVSNSEAAPGVCVVYLGLLDLLAYDSWEGRVVVPSGGLIQLAISEVGSPPDVYVGGYLLRNTAA